MRIYIAGHSGLVGSALVRAVDSRPDLTWIGKTHIELDLTDRKAVFDYVNQEKPDAVIIAAAKVGGIMANKTYPVEFLSQNIQISTNLMDAAHNADVERLIFLGSSCVYPKLSPQPIKEEYLLTGPLEETNEAYAIAKIAGIKLVESYRKQHGRKWISVMPTNLYGPGDNYDLLSSHIIPALIRKFYEAKKINSSEITLWGTGSPKREFMHSEDLAEGVLFLIQKGFFGELINLGTGEEVSILELAFMISEIAGYEGLVNWDSTFPDGTPRKLLDSSTLKDLGWMPKIHLRDGLAKEYRRYVENSK